MGDSPLTIDLNREDKEPAKEPLTSLAAFVEALGKITSKDDIEQKTELSNDNIQGIIQLLTFNDHVERNFGFRIKEFDWFVAQKLIKTVSYHRKGKDELIELFRAMKLDITGEEKDNKMPIMITRR